MTRIATILKAAATMPTNRARAVVSALMAANSEDGLQASRKRAAMAFEEDMHGIREALAAALHTGGLIPLQGVRAMMPGLLREANRDSALGTALARAMIEAVANMSSPLKAASVGSINFSEEAVETDALKQWRSREVFETDLGSAELRGFASQIRDRAVFSARTTNAEYLKEVAHVVDEILSGNIGMSEGRWLLMKKLKQLGYDPTTGFPGDVGAVPPAERDSLQDLSSEQRIDLVLETNVRMAQGYAQVVTGLSDYALRAYPAWELVRLYRREIERGTPESKSPGWMSRWHDAGEAIEWDGAINIGNSKDHGTGMIALKSSPIWDALGDGAGGYVDTLLNPFPPFAFRSGMAWRAVPRGEVEKLGLIEHEQVKEGRVKARLTPGAKEIRRVVESFPADLRAEIEREVAEGGAA